MARRKYDGTVSRRGDFNNGLNVYKEGDLKVQVHGQRPLPFTSPRDKVSGERDRQNKL